MGHSHLTESGRLYPIYFASIFFCDVGTREIYNKNRCLVKSEGPFLVSTKQEFYVLRKHRITNN